jgi:hypothetical protein
MISGVPKNTYTLTMGDNHWIYEHLDLSPVDFIRGLLRLRFTAAARRFRSLGSLADAAFAFIRENDYEFSQHDIDRLARERFLARRDRTSRKMLEEFLLLWRGYTNEDILRAKAALPEDRVRWLESVEGAIAKNSLLLKRAVDKGRGNRVREIKANGKELEQLKRRIVEAEDEDQNRLACQKAMFEVLYRRNAVVRMIYASPRDYLGIESFLEEKDPMVVSFPLRFMAQFMIAGEYLKLRKEWTHGSPREEVLLDLEDGDSSEGSGMEDALLELNQKILLHLHVDRSIPIREIEVCYRQKCFLAAALVGITQAEGVIWDFASYLNGHNIRVFKRSGPAGRILHPYPWDRFQCRYKRSSYPRWDPSVRLISARNVLENTRVGSIISPELYSYFNDEFYDDRNTLTHGRIYARNLKLDAIAAILAFYACLHEVDRYLSAKCGTGRS